MKQIGIDFVMLNLI